MKLDKINLKSSLCSAVAQKSWCEKGSLLMMLHLCCIVRSAFLISADKLPIHSAKVILIKSCGGLFLLKVWASWA